MATGVVIITGELMATGQAETQSVQTAHDDRIVASQGPRFVCWQSSSLSGIAALFVNCLASLSLVLFQYLLPQNLTINRSCGCGCTPVYAHLLVKCIVCCDLHCSVISAYA